MKKLIVLLSICLFCIANSLEFNTLSSDFNQTVISGNQKITYSGYFIADKQIGAFWDYKTPINKFIYFNYKKVIIIEPQLEQAIITNLKDSPNLAKILSQATQISNDTFKAKFDDITYNIKTQNGLVKTITYTDKLDNEIIIELSNTKKDEPINKALLEPIIPNNYDILSH